MRITSITITNLAAFAEWSSLLPAVAILEGPHGVGKTSIERVLMYAFGRRPLAGKGSRAVQHDPGMLHGQAERGEAILTFEGGDIESLRVVVKPDSTQRTVKMRGRKAWEDAGQLIDDITSALAYNPMSFADLEPKERIEAFLKVVPVDISVEETVAAIGGVVPWVGKPSLEAINAIYEDIYKARTSENSAADTQAKYASQLEAALPPAVEGDDWNAEVARLRADKAVLEASEAEEIKRVSKEFQDAKDAAAQVRRASESAVDKVLATDLDIIDQQIKALEAKKYELRSVADIQKSGFATTETQAVESARAAANTEASEIRTHNAPIHATLTTDIATADERSRAAAQADVTRESARVARQEAEGHKAKSAAMTAALERLAALKAEVAGRMSIKGVTVASPRAGLPVDICRQEGESLVGFSRWNSASQDQFCLRMAILFRGACGVVCIDNLANFSPERQRGIIDSCRKYAREKGMQFLLGMATDSGELRIVDAMEAAVSAVTDTEASNG